MPFPKEHSSCAETLTAMKYWRFRVLRENPKGLQILLLCHFLIPGHLLCFGQLSAPIPNT